MNADLVAADPCTMGPCAMLLGTLLMESPKSETSSEVVRGICAMDLVNEWPYGTAEEKKGIASLFEDARGLSLDTLDREYHHLFVGPNNLQAPPWGSVYLDSEAVVFGDSCVALVRWMRENGVALHEDSSREPADQIGRVLVLLAWLCDNEPALVDDYLRLHVLTWAFRYFEGLEAAAEGPFYRAVAKLASATLADIAVCRGLK